jgi:hypothetical protein
MYTFLSLQQEFQHDREMMTRQLGFIKALPLQKRIALRGRSEQWKVVRLSPYYPGQIKRVTGATKAIFKRDGFEIF